MAFDVEQADRESKQSWANAAPRWERWQDKLREVMAPLGQWLVDAVDPQPGERILELAAGSGDTGFDAAERIAPDGRLTSTDQAAEMVEVARRRAAARGIENAEFAQLDAQRMDLPDDAFDAAICRFGYMLMADRDAALRETRRVLKPGGRLALATWAPPDRNMWIAAAALPLFQRGAMAIPEPGAPSVFALPSEDVIRPWIEGAGMEVVELTTVAWERTYDSFDAYWEETLDLAAPVADAFGSLDSEQRSEVVAQARELLAPLGAGDGPWTAPACAMVALARA